MKFLHKLAHTNSNLSFKIERLEKENTQLKQALKEIRKMLIIADNAKDAETHFRNMDNALIKTKEVLNEQST